MSSPECLCHTASTAACTRGRTSCILQVCVAVPVDAENIFTYCTSCQNILYSWIRQGFELEVWQYLYKVVLLGVVAFAVKTLREVVVPFPPV